MTLMVPARDNFILQIYDATVLRDVPLLGARNVESLYDLIV